MNLNDLVAASPAKHYKKILEGHFGHRINVDNLSGRQATQLLNRVRGLISESRNSSSAHYNERNPSYLKLMVVEQALKQFVLENTMPAPTQVQSPAEQQKAKSQQMAAVQKIQDPKLQTAMKKSVGGQNLSKDEQQTVTNAMMGGAVAEGRGSRDVDYDDEGWGTRGKSKEQWMIRVDGRNFKAVSSSNIATKIYHDLVAKGHEVEVFPMHLEEGSGPKGKQRTPYTDINSPEYKARADNKRQGMAKRDAAKPGKALLSKIDKKKINESEVQQAQVILASQDLVDQVQKMIEQCTSIQFKDLPALVNQIKNEIGYDQAVQFNNDATSALSTLVQGMQGAKQQLESAVGVVTGQQTSMPSPGATDLGATPPPPPAGGAVGGDIDVDMDFEEPAPSPDAAVFGRDRVMESRARRRR